MFDMKEVFVFFHLLMFFFLSSCFKEKVDDSVPLSNFIVEQEVKEKKEQDVQDDVVVESLDVLDNTEQKVVNDVKLIQDFVVYFDFDKSLLSEEALLTLDKHIAFLLKNPDRGVVLEGHSDERGTQEYNIALGKERGNSVLEYFLSYGASADNIEVVSFGEEHPKNLDHNSVAWDENRRVEIRYIEL
jgi:peptidoglycan-associated lipoprotein